MSVLSDKWIKQAAKTKGMIKPFVDRQVRKGARPFIILFPFGPVEFVYDHRDTMGPHIAKEEILNWWREGEGVFSEKIYKNTTE